MLRACAAKRWALRAVGEVDVHQPVAVVIEHRHAAGHRFDLVFLRCGRVLEREGDACLRRDIDEARRREDLVQHLRRGRGRTPLERPQRFAYERIAGIERRRAARLRFGLVAAIHAKQEYRIGGVRFGIGLRPPRVGCSSGTPARPPPPAPRLVTLAKRPR